MPGITINAPKQKVILIEVDSISHIEEAGLTLITGSDSAGKVVEAAISTKFFEKIKADVWCVEGAVVRVVAEERIEAKTTYTDDAGETQLHKSSGLSCNRLSKGSMSTWKRELEDKSSARQQAAKSSNASKALDLLSEAIEKGLSEEAAAILIGKIMA